MTTTVPQADPPAVGVREACSHTTPDPRPFNVHGREGHLGYLRAVLWSARLLVLDAPRVPGGMLLIPFEAIERMEGEERRILLRPAREALELTAQRSRTRRGGDRDGF